MTPAEMAAADAQASVLMKKGIGLLQRGPENADEALGFFDRARALRARLPLDVPMHRFGLAACWMNRAEALMHSAGADSRALTLGAYDEAIALLGPLPLSEDARFVKRLAIAHQNRGLTLCAQEPAALADAAGAFADAIAVLEHADAANLPDRTYLQAVVWMNLANARAWQATAESDAMSRDAAHRAVALVSASERSDANAAEVGLKARLILCQTIARRLSAHSAAQSGGMPEDVHDATDMADDGLSVVREWERRGVTDFRSLASDLFRFGALVYGRYQPQFLQEFVRENLDAQHSSPEYVDMLKGSTP